MRVSLQMSLCMACLLRNVELQTTPCTWPVGIAHKHVAIARWLEGIEGGDGIFVKVLMLQRLQQNTNDLM